MPLMNAWATSDRRVLLSLADPVLTVFQEHIQHMPTDKEAGGLLLGTVHGSNLALTEATAPTSRDRRLRYLFERLPFGHRAIAAARWRSSGGTVRYLGEWHTHPEDFPTPSGIDRTEWAELSRKRTDGRPLLAIIVGRKSLYVELVLPTGAGLILEPAT
jgi:integrative and conjugative element protein (TIGR02256 family)